MSDSLWPHGLQHARLPCPPPTPWAFSNSCPSSQWCHPTISSSSIIPFFSHLQSFPASESFPMSQFFPSGGQSIGISASASVLPMNIQDWFPLGLIGWISLQSKRLSRFFSNITVQKHIYYMYYLSISWMESIYFIRILKPFGERHSFIDFSCSCTSYRMCLEGKVLRTFTWYIFQVWISRK